MNKTHLKFLAVILACLAASSAWAENTYTLTCRITPKNIALYKRAMRNRIEMAIDPASYNHISVAVRMKLVGRDTSTITKTTTELTPNLNLTTQNFPEGFSFGVEGSLQIPDTCSYRFQVFITTKGRVVSSGERVIAKTTSEVTLYDQFSGSYKEQRP
ncbi:MAG: hypothetical protein K1X83_07540 [Oligoflexia bacterium]|nr:hypothetical protein [Oligoflexia bacterium]